jgi:hypothetical protein
VREAAQTPRELTRLSGGDRSPAMLPPDDRTFVFVGGLHRSGTTLVARLLASHPLISGFSGTGAREDEGQYLQSVFPTGNSYGGPGRFAFAGEMHVTERSPLASERNRQRLWSEWRTHWDEHKPVLVEKSPPNILKTRLLQAMFPDARFVLVMRHPVANVEATRKWTRGATRARLLRHWLACHETMAGDLPFLDRAIVVRYEDLIARPASELSRLLEFVGVAPRRSELEVRNDINESYFASWEQAHGQLLGALHDRLITYRFAERVARFGYSLTDLRRPSQPHMRAAWAGVEDAADPESVISDG